MQIHNQKGVDHSEDTSTVDMPTKSDVDRASILTQDSDVPAWYRDGCDEQSYDQGSDGEETTSIIIVHKEGPEPSDKTTVVLGKTSVGPTIETEFDDYEDADYELEDEDEADDLYVPESPTRYTSIICSIFQLSS